MKDFMAMDYCDWSQEKEDAFEEHIEDESLFDENMLTPEQRVEVDKLYKEDPILTRRDLAVMIRLNLISHRAALEGRQLTFFEINIAHALEEVIYWVPPSKLKGISYSTFEICDEDNHMPCIDDIASSFQTPMIIDECYDLICKFQDLNSLRVEKLAKNYHELCFDINDFQFQLSMLEESRCLVQNFDLGDVLDIDKIINEFEIPKVEIDLKESDVVLYMINGDEVDYFLMNSFKPEVDFIFPFNAFDHPRHSFIKSIFIFYATLVVNFFDEKYVFSPCATMCSFGYIVLCSNRRRTKGALAQPFDSRD